MSFSETSDKDDSCPALSLSTDKTNIFVADQTPTPTRLIRNCEEIGLFDDLLKHDNPFDETFRRAIAEQSYDETIANNRPLERSQASVEDLHTPQVYQQDENIVANPTFQSNLNVQSVETLPGNTCVSLDLPCLPVTEEQIIHERAVINENDFIVNGNNNNNYLPAAKIVHIVQPQAVTWHFPNNNSSEKQIKSQLESNASRHPKAILPKPTNETEAQTEIATKPATNLLIPSANNIHHEPSSASLTPTSQLPIKERLKAIINNNRFFDESKETQSKTIPKKNFNNRMKFCNKDDDSLERKRAACVRYRTKIRSEQKELKRENEELKMKNKKLIERVKYLEKELEKSRSSVQIITPNGLQSDSCQLRIPPSSINLVINVPSLVLPVGNDQHTLFHSSN